MKGNITSNQQPTALSNNELSNRFYDLSCLVELAVFAIDSENGTHSARYALTILDSKLAELSDRYADLA